MFRLVSSWQKLWHPLTNKRNKQLAEWWWTNRKTNGTLSLFRHFKSTQESDIGLVSSWLVHMFSYWQKKLSLITLWFVLTTFTIVFFSILSTRNKTFEVLHIRQKLTWGKVNFPDFTRTNSTFLGTFSCTHPKTAKHFFNYNFFFKIKA